MSVIDLQRKVKFDFDRKRDISESNASRLTAIRELFPTRLSFLVFVLYITLFVGQGLLVTASQSDKNEYQYNIVTVVLMTEVFKLVASIGLYCKDRSVIFLVNDVIKDKKVLYLYLVPAALYCLYNNLSFVNLATFDPTTYYLLLQFRVVVTAIFFQIIFKTQLSRKQWLSLCLLTFGCMLKQFNYFNDETNEQEHNKKSGALELNINAILIIMQVFCSCVAGVYNEYLLKFKGSDVNIYIQNVYMYLDSIICNVIVLALKGDLSEAFIGENFLKLFHFKVLIVMINNAAIGIITSFFLKTLNSILKTFASALELVLTAVLSYLLFSIPIYLNTVFAIATVLYAVYLYSQNPVTASNVPYTSADSKESEDKEMLLSENV